jgi:hypothetical protein
VAQDARLTSDGDSQCPPQPPRGGGAASQCHSDAGVVAREGNPNTDMRRDLPPQNNEKKNGEKKEDKKPRPWRPALCTLRSRQQQEAHLDARRCGFGKEELARWWVQTYRHCPGRPLGGQST